MIDEQVHLFISYEMAKNVKCLAFLRKDANESNFWIDSLIQKIWSVKIVIIFQLPTIGNRNIQLNVQ